MQYSCRKSYSKTKHTDEIQIKYTLNLNLILRNISNYITYPVCNHNYSQRIAYLHQHASCHTAENRLRNISIFHPWSNLDHQTIAEMFGVNSIYSIPCLWNHRNKTGKSIGRVHMDQYCGHGSNNRSPNRFEPNRLWIVENGFHLLWTNITQQQDGLTQVGETEPTHHHRESNPQQPELSTLNAIFIQSPNETESNPIIIRNDLPSPHLLQILNEYREFSDANSTPSPHTIEVTRRSITHLSYMERTSDIETILEICRIFMERHQNNWFAKLLTIN